MKTSTKKASDLSINELVKVKNRYMCIYEISKSVDTTTITVFYNSEDTEFTFKNSELMKVTKY